MLSFPNQRKVRRNYDLFSACSWFTPGIGGVFMTLAWFLVGLILAGFVMLTLTLTLPDLGLSYVTLIMYPLQFIPLLIYVKIKSGSNAGFDRGYSLDSDHFGQGGGLVSGLMAIAAALSAAFVLELVNSWLPDMDAQLLKSMEAMLGGPLWVSLLSVCVLAPLLEEWLCRGIVLRGLLNFKRDALDNGERKRGMSPALAIVISAFFFAAIHGNVWQGVTAFLLGCVMGYVYYKTGSLKLTMLMHCANNLASLLVSRYGGEEIASAASLADVMPKGTYYTIFVLAIVILAISLRYFSDVRTIDGQGNCDIIPST